MKKIITLGAGAALSILAMTASAAAGDTYPTKPIRLIVSFAAGGVNDLVGRVLQPAVSAELGQTVVIENRGGAGGNLGAEAVAKADPDGYTLLLSSNALILNPFLYPKLSYDLFKDLKPIARLATFPLAFVTRPTEPSNTLQEFLQATRVKQKTYASPGTGTPNHLAGELLQVLTGAQMLHVPYKGAGPATVDLMAGTVDSMFLSVALANPMVKTGKAKMLAVASETRTPLAPNAPTFDESGVKNFRADTYTLIFAPAATPATIVDRVYRAYAKVVAMPEIQAKLVDLGTLPTIQGPAEVATALRQEYQQWGDLIRKQNIKGE
jgi:tripartite-type tricarboxylate transporter receptor subunit TctC